MNEALLDETVAECRAKTEYRIVVLNVAIRDDQPQLVALRDLVLGRGFEEVGRIREISEKEGVVLDRAILQIRL